MAGPWTKVSMLESSEVAALLGVRVSDLPGRLPKRVKAMRALGQRLYRCEDLERHLGAGRAARLRRAAEGKGWNLVRIEETVFGHPVLSKYWHPDNELRPWRLGLGATQMAWWECPEGPDHEFERVVNRSRKKGKWSGCPYCAGRLVSVTNCLATVAPKTAAQWHPTKNGARTPRDIVGRSSEYARAPTA